MSRAHQGRVDRHASPQPPQIHGGARSMSTKNPLLVRFGARGPTTRTIVCFPYAGGGASLFKEWWKLVPPDIDVIAVQPPGRENRFTESPYRRLQPLVSAVVESLQAYVARPFALFGYSMGALVAFEVARALVREHESSLRHLFVAARACPDSAATDTDAHLLDDDSFIEHLSSYRKRE